MRSHRGKGSAYSSRSESGMHWLGAGRYVRGEVSRVSDGWLVQAFYRDVRLDSTLAHASLTVGPKGAPPDAYGALVDSLLLRGAADTTGGRGGRSSKSLPAIQSF